MKVASYNILSGGFSSYSFDLTTPDRLKLLIKAVGIIDADFIGLIDTFRWDNLYKNSQIASLFGYKKAYCINLNDSRLKKKGHNNGITVLTNLPVEHFETVNLGTRDAVRTTIRLNNEKVDIFSVYLDDLSEDVRIGQVQSLLKFVENDKPTIIMGDLNTLDTEDIVRAEPLINKFAASNPQLYKNMAPVLNEMRRGEVTKILKEFGLQDADKSGEPTAPSKLFPAKIEDAILRIDYAFHTNEIQTINFKVMKGGVFDQSSDHYPIAFQLSIKN
ncbi:hypothetical protein A2686_04970 [Candidatus Woesebacteria bacterium RIFCSPHIGHO2_01_FULL_38_10]|uniref:Endonuclease/exonuclease/phosphatase domain-containing protein n=1 Tax=Candidatus Woesebacteria bacterium RIFCSPLOWO2_01_FULL_39_10b TaxID=1802517 RepID=A0A1F8BA64_9BACT|nr:MAG: hypothetical protein A2686_04970 [Candidatus Woesebacteria bacterium RIFCSPHIGHO2_01_FULL_38_10]OGM60258.1 MAG: hypothetical protein A2892_04775 [Candidatus Woesebacteria bacterium RIFCSPLOWO2_01_FULL_39_10b]